MTHDLQLSLVLLGDLPKTVPLVSTYLEEAASRTRGRCTATDLLRMIFNGQYTLWAVFDARAQRVHGCFVTEVKAYPQMNMLAVQHCVIDENLMEQVEEKMQETAANFARDAGCAGIEFTGRPGWRRHAEKYGYVSNSVSYTKFISKVTS